MDVIQLNKDLQKEGQMLLESTGLIQKLENFGYIEMGGSYIYGTMVDRDIDINVIVDANSINFNLRKHVMEMLIDIQTLDGIAMSDRANFPVKNRPNGFWFGPILWGNGHKWNIDIWFVTQNEPNAHHNLELHKRMLQITDDQRNIMLNIKYESFANGTKEKGITSSKIYEAVLDNNVTNYIEFISLTEK